MGNDNFTKTDPHMQSDEEWLRNYDKAGNSNSSIVSLISNQSETVPKKYLFLSFRTTKNGRAILSFTDISSGEIADMFFNVDIKKQRGNDKGEYHRTGANGQFLPKPGSKFRQFWKQAVSIPPRRWSRVHKEMKVKLRDIIFTGYVERAQKSDGRFYMKISNLQRAQ